MIQNTGALVTGQRTIVSDDTPLTHWQQDASAAILLTPSALRLIGSDWYYVDTPGASGDGALVSQNSTGDLYVKPNADSLYAGYTQRGTLIRNGLLEGYLL